MACRTSVILSALSLAPPAAAQSASFRSVDTNSDGVLTRDELVATFGARGARRLLERSDHNGDGQLTIWELRRDRANGQEEEKSRTSDEEEDDDDESDDSDKDDDEDGDSDD